MGLYGAAHGASAATGPRAEHDGRGPRASQPEHVQLKYIVGNRSTTFLVKDTEFACSNGAYRPGEPGTNYFRTMHWLFPWVTMTPVIKLGQSANCVITVPLDDTHTMSWNMTTGRLDQPPSNAPRPGAGRDLLPNTRDFLGRYRLRFFYETAASGDFDFGVDREVQNTSRTVTGYTGMPSVIVQDSAITWSQGAIVDRSREALGSTDAMIIRVRRRLLTAAKELRERGTIPPGVNEPDLYRQRSGWALVPEDRDFWDYVRVGMVGDITGLDPFIWSPNNSNTVGQVHDQLITYDEKFSPKPRLAESWELSSDNKRIRFNLRKGVQFHNGRELTSDDIEYNLLRAQDPKNAQSRDSRARRSLLEQH